MKTPGNWRQQMSQSVEASRILANIDAEICVDVALQQSFNDSLEASYVSPDEARDAAIKVVETEPDKYFCQGRIVPSQRFVRVVRFQDPAKWPYMVADEKSIRRRGVKADSTLGGISDRQRKWFSEHLSQQELQVGKLGMIVWVTELERASWRNGDLRDILRCLGMPHFSTSKLSIVLEYDKKSVGNTLHVPRAFDGIGWWPFELQADCASQVGMTLPLGDDVAGNGLPESVHRSNRFQAGHVNVEVRFIDG